VKYYGNKAIRFDKLVERYKKQYPKLSEAQALKLAHTTISKRRVYGLRKSLGL
jgi:hypothetical protein